MNNNKYKLKRFLEKYAGLSDEDLKNLAIFVMWDWYDLVKEELDKRIKAAFTKEQLENMEEWQERAWKEDHKLTPTEFFAILQLRDERLRNKQTGHQTKGCQDNPKNDSGKVAEKFFKILENLKEIQKAGWKCINIEFKKENKMVRKVIERQRKKQVKDEKKEK
ncbi:MAG: hypothetical protein LBF37_01700, partial [Rickettsiales bacterium]|nr:hypothetical protein [Rickettsiales bacterium]